MIWYMTLLLLRLSEIMEQMTPYSRRYEAGDQNAIGPLLELAEVAHGLCEKLAEEDNRRHDEHGIPRVAYPV